MSEDIEIINQNARIEKLKIFFKKLKEISRFVNIVITTFILTLFTKNTKRQKAEIAEIIISFL